MLNIKHEESALSYLAC